MPRIKKTLTPSERLERARRAATVAELELIVEPIGITASIDADESIEAFTTRLAALVQTRLDDVALALAAVNQQLIDMKDVGDLPKAAE